MYQKTIDNLSRYKYNLFSAIQINTQTVVKAQFTTGGRLGVSLCQM